MLSRRVRIAVTALALSACGVAARGDELSYTEMASFTSDLNNDVILTFPTFDNQGGALTLQDVRVDFRHVGRVRLGADNDDPFKTADVRGRIIRAWNASGPGVVTNEFRVLTTPIVFLDVDNGDGITFDPNPPDGTTFGGPLFYDELGDTFHPALALYETNGPGTIDYTVDVSLMVNDLQFQGPPPDRWTLEVQDPLLQVETTITYTFVPEPASLLLLALGGAGLLLRRHRWSSGS